MWYYSTFSFSNHYTLIQNKFPWSAARVKIIVLRRFKRLAFMILTSAVSRLVHLAFIFLTPGGSLTALCSFFVWKLRKSDNIYLWPVLSSKVPISGFQNLFWNNIFYLSLIFLNTVLLMKVSFFRNVDILSIWISRFSRTPRPMFWFFVWLLGHDFGHFLYKLVVNHFPTKICSISHNLIS